MGIRMTRDLQRNLELMKEMEQEKTNANKITDAENWLTRNNIGILRRSPSNETLKETSRGDNGDSDNTGVSKSHPGQNKVGESSLGDNNLNERNNLFMSKLGTPIEISIEDNGDGKPFDAEDDLFARLVAGIPATISSANETLRKQFSGSDSDCDWEEGALEGKRSSFHGDSEMKIKSPNTEANNSDDSEVEWEEGFSGITENTSSYSYPSEFKKTTSKGYNEEDADLQEAIKRSLEDIGDVKCSHAGKQVLFKADNICDEVSGLSKTKQKNVGKLSLKETECKDYLEVGCGFCPSEDETSELGLSNVDQYFQADVSDDNIKMAGRFSRAENEIGANRDGIDYQATGTTVSGNGDLSDFSGFIYEADLGHVSVQSNLPTKRPLVGLLPGSGRTSAYDSEQSLNHHIFTSIVPSTSNVSPQENTVDSSGQPSIGALSAMPFLREKRRKS